MRVPRRRWNGPRHDDGRIGSAVPRSYRPPLHSATRAVNESRLAYAAGHGTRRRPSVAVQARVLTDQNARCLYCGCRFGSAIRRGYRSVVLRLEWDHMVPFDHLRANPEDNWAASCHVCNGIKADYLFDTIEQARNYIVARRKSKGYDPAEWTREHEDGEEREMRETLAKMPRRPVVRFIGVKPQTKKPARLVAGNFVKVRQLMFVFENAS